MTSEGNDNVDHVEVQNNESFYRKSTNPEPTNDEERDISIVRCISRNQVADFIPGARLTGLAHVSFSDRRPLDHLWVTFKTLDKAYDYISTSGIGKLRVFAKEKVSLEGNSIFSYVVADIDSFWRDYYKTDPGGRHYYEVIPECMPCRVYFDLEFNLEMNSSVIGDDLVLKFIEFVRQETKGRYGVDISLKDIVWLDSSTSVKYSSHIIVSPKREFVLPCNLDCGVFVKSLSDLAREVAPEFYLNTSSGEQAFLADLSVYSRNRNFRLFLSSKVFKRVPLLISRCSEKHSLRNESEKKLKNAFLDSLVVPPSYSFSELADHLFTCASSNRGQVERKLGFTSNHGISGWHDSLDSFVASQFQSMMLESCWIRSTFRNTSKGYVRYDVGGTRYCMRIMRNHTSNHIYLIADLSRKTVHQMCHDMDCAGYVSPPLFMIPDHLCQDPASCSSFPDSSEDLFEGSTLTDEDVVKIDKDFGDQRFVND